MPSCEEIANAAKYDHGAQQKEQELAACLNFLVKNKVETILEIGCDAGGTLYAWGRIAKKVYGITLLNGGFASGLPLYDHRATIFTGNSHDPHTVKRLEDCLGDTRVDFLFIDGDHTYDGVFNDFWIYKRFVRDWGFIGIHDICEYTDMVNDLKVHLFWDSLKEQFPHWLRWEFKQFPYNWGGIGIIENRPNVARQGVSLTPCEDKKWIEHPTRPGMDFYLSCDFPKGHNIGVASRHHRDGIYWW